MVEIQPLCGVRFNSHQSGPVGPLLAPPYDVASANGGAPKFSISAIENADLGVAGDQHQVAAQRYRAWLDQGVLAADREPAIYIHQHRFLVDGRPVTRTGLIARVRLWDWGDGIVLPHEQTYPRAREERLERLRAVGANLSPLYFLFRDPDGEVRGLVQDALQGAEPAFERDRQGGEHALVAITDPRNLARLLQGFAHRRLFVADGHHRYEAALAHRDALRRRYPNVDGPWNFVLALLSAVEDPGVVVRPTHRLLEGGSSLSPQEVRQTVERWFAIDDRAGDRQPLFQFVVPGAKRVLSASALPGNPHLALLPRDRGAAWRRLGVSAVEGIAECIIGAGRASNARRIVPVVDAAAVVARVQAAAAHAAFLLPVPELDQLLSVAEEGDLLPPKSTWFEPKAPAGLVINDLRLSDPASASGR